MENELTVYILTYNRAKYLKHAIESVLNQTFKGYELYVLDNCSEDNTSEVVGSYDDERLHYIRHETNIGGRENIIYAIEHCQTKYFVIFHDDDVMSPIFLEKEYEVLQSKSDIMAVACNAMRINAKGDEQVPVFDEREEIIFSEGELLHRYLESGRYLIFPSIMYRSDFLKEKHICLSDGVGPCVDVIFYCDIERFGGKILELPEVLMQSRRHEEQDSTMNLTSMHIELITYMRNTEYYAEYLDTHEELQEQMARRLMKYVVIEALDEKNEWEDVKSHLDCIMKLLHCNDSMLRRNKFKVAVIKRFPKMTKKIYEIYKKVKF